MATALQNKTTKSLLWKFLESFGSQGIQLVVSIILARLLLPSDYGVISLVTIFIAIANVITTSGFSIALVRQKEADDLDYSTAFYTSLIIAVGLYLLLFFLAPVIAEFYNTPILTNVLRVLSLTIILGSYNSIQQAVLQRKMLFKRLFFSSFGAALFSGAVGIGLAYGGFGVWALVAQQLVASSVTIIIMSFTVKWHPVLKFSLKRLKCIWKFGILTLLSSLMGTFFTNIIGLIIGKIYTIDDLAFYNKGFQLANMVTLNITNAFSSVMLPVLAMHQDNLDGIKQIDKRTIISLSYILFPILFGIVAVAPSLIDFVFTAKWAPTVLFLQAFCVIDVWMPIILMNLQSLNAIGRNDKVLYIEIFKNIIELAALLISMRFGLVWLMFAKVIASIISGVSNAFWSKKYFNYSIWEQLKDQLKNFVTAVIMCVVVYTINYTHLSSIIKLLIQVPLGIVVYGLMSIVTRNKTFFEFVDNIKSTLNKKRGNKMKKGVVVTIMGGLGNQMSQYAFYKNIQKQNDNVKYELSFYDHNNEHNGYELDRIFDIDTDNVYHGSIQPTFMQRVLNKLKIKKYLYDDDSFLDVKDNVSKLNNCLLYGYWHSPIYRYNLSDEEIYQIFRFKNSLDDDNAKIAEDIENSNSISIHVRHGDYVNLQNLFKILDLQYYKDAMKYIEKTVDNPKYFVFSDDIEWCKQQFIGDNFVFVSNNTGEDSYKDMQLMSLCKHNIIANSSFSIWGAILNQNKDKIVCAPKDYYNDGSVKPMDWDSYGFTIIDN